MHASDDELSPAELATITGFKRVSTQARMLVQMRIPFTFSRANIKVLRAVALEHEIMPPGGDAGPESNWDALN